MFQGMRTEIIAGLAAVTMICLTVLMALDKITLGQLAAAVPGALGALAAVTAAWRANRVDESVKKTTREFEAFKENGK